MRRWPSRGGRGLGRFLNGAFGQLLMCLGFVIQMHCLRLVSPNRYRLVTVLNITSSAVDTNDHSRIPLSIDSRSSHDVFLRFLEAPTRVRTCSLEAALASSFVLVLGSRLRRICLLIPHGAVLHTPFSFSFFFSSLQMQGHGDVRKI